MVYKYLLAFISSLFPFYPALSKPQQCFFYTNQQKQWRRCAFPLSVAQSLQVLCTSSGHCAFGQFCPYSFFSVPNTSSALKQVSILFKTSFSLSSKLFPQCLKNEIKIGVSLTFKTLVFLLDPNFCKQASHFPKYTWSIPYIPFQRPLSLHPSDSHLPFPSLFTFLNTCIPLPFT